MAEPAHLAIFLQGADPWNEWRRSNPDVRPDLSGVVSAGSLAGYDLSNADLTRAVLPHVNFADSGLTGTILREAILRDADLTGVKGLMQPSQVAGADLSGAQLPDSLQESLGDLDVAKGISGNAQKLFVAVLAACLYCWLTISTTTDASLIINRASSPLPIIQTAIPIVDFYIIAPLLILCVYFYFHLYLQKLWDELSAQPAIFPDGRPLHAKADPWLLSDLVQSHLFHLRSERPLLAYFQVWIARLLAWWVVPLTLALFWLRYLVRQNPAGTAYHCILTAIAASGAFSLHGLAVRTLRGAPRHRFSPWPLSTSGNAWRIAVTAVASVSLLSLFSLAIFKGVRQRPWLPQADGPGAWLPDLLSQIGYKPFADLTGAELSVKPPNWSEKSDPGLDNILGLRLGEVSLRFADMPLAFLPKARLSGLNLHGAEMIASDLRKAHLGDADLSQANLEGARLDGADLKRADLQVANLFHTDFSGAELLYANFQNATGLTFDAAQKGKDWCEAQYPGAFHLGSAYNQRIQAHNNADRDFARSGEIAREIARIEEIKRTNPTASLDDIEKAYYSKATAVPGDDLQSDEPQTATAPAIKPIPWPAGETPAAQPLASTP